MDDESDSASEDVSDDSQGSYDGSYDGVDDGGTSAFTSASDAAPSEGGSDGSYDGVDDGGVASFASAASVDPGLNDQFGTAAQGAPDVAGSLTPGPAADFDLGTYGGIEPVEQQAPAQLGAGRSFGLSPYGGGVVSQEQEQAELGERFAAHDAYWDHAAPAPATRDDWASRNPTSLSDFDSEFGFTGTAAHPAGNVFGNLEVANTWNEAIAAGRGGAIWSDVAGPEVVQGQFGQHYVGPPEAYGRSPSAALGRDDWSRTEGPNLGSWGIPREAAIHQAPPSLPAPGFGQRGPEGQYGMGPYGSYPFDTREAHIPTIDQLAQQRGLDIGVDYMTPAQMQQYHDLVEQLDRARGGPGPGRSRQ